MLISSSSTSYLISMLRPENTYVHCYIAQLRPAQSMVHVIFAKVVLRQVRDVGLLDMRDVGELKNADIHGGGGVFGVGGGGDAVDHLRCSTK